LLGIVLRQLVRIVARCARHGQDAAGFRLDRDGRAILAGKSLVGGHLQLRVD
jgi:hypothetical protein